ncbi:hypothetical protein C1752_04342 [Acaryochloris thomasi RCC1774]|uniref:DUF4112 domain-containing protein n=1 Tax=Acaryochloris thomasi RCC1774 TaxID=1764569 RepID=A0A2W1JP81_9CYAN|nr:DUF4112 domain-containing protein [Acaryochloris thomasi]PZD71964.1 hypothetical protein C1752_04342 [Acaryochloris thomasi RCC1774]
MSQLKPVETISSSASDRVQNLRRLAFLLDNSIPVPGTKFRFGLDPILGLLGIAAGSGDVVGGAVGAYIVSQAARMGVPSDVIWQMVGNILLDSLAGLVPGLGDLLDFAWKANTRNMALLDQHLPTASTLEKGNPFFVFGITLLTVLIVVGCAFLTLFFIKAVLQLLA